MRHTTKRELNGQLTGSLASYPGKWDSRRSKMEKVIKPSGGVVQQDLNPLIRLLPIDANHACRPGILLLENKGIRKIELIPVSTFMGKWWRCPQS